MSIASNHVAFFRSQWADRLVDAATGRRITGRGAMNTTTYQYDSEAVTVVYTSGPCLIRSMSAQAQADEFGQESQTRIGFTLILPYDATGILPDDEFTVDVSVTDAEMVGKILIVRGASYDSYRVNTKLVCEQALGGGLQV